MSRNAIAAAVLATLLIPAEHSGQTGKTSADEAALALPTPAMLAVWTDKPGYLRRRDLISVYLAVKHRGEGRRLREFIYMENIETGQRRYLVRNRGFPRLRDEVVDVRDRSPKFRAGEFLRDLPPTKIWSGQELEPGLWQFVAELRSPDTTEIVKRAAARYVVSPRIPVVLGADGRDTEISTDTTWTNDVIRSIRHQVFVNAGATLTIEPGTLVLARGPEAVIVVEKGGKIMAQGRPDAPIVMTCDAPLGQRSEGCWGGLVVLGNAPTTRGTSLAGGVVPEARPTYGGFDPRDSSGVLQYVRVEFAGAVHRSGAPRAGLGFFGVGSGTLIDHVQAHASAGDGLVFFGGTANCMYCVSSGAMDDGLAWALGWQGTAQQLYLQQSPAGRGCGIWGGHDELNFDALPRSSPRLYNITVVSGSGHGATGSELGKGICLGSGSALTARNALVMGFASGAIDMRDNSGSLFLDGTSSFASAILSANGSRGDNAQVNGGGDGIVQYRDVAPLLVNVGNGANPDPRPLLDSPALMIGAGSVPPSDGVLETDAQFIGAFGRENWLERWTFFGAETDYDMRPLESTDDQP